MIFQVYAYRMFILSTIEWQPHPTCPPTLPNSPVIRCTVPHHPIPRLAGCNCNSLLSLLAIFTLRRLNELRCSEADACSPVHLLHIFTTPFCKYTYGGLLMYFFNSPGNLILLVLALERSNIFINKSMSSKDGVLKRHTLVVNLCKCLPSLRQNLNINCIF